jgi:hypothetical protein
MGGQDILPIFGLTKMGGNLAIQAVEKKSVCIVSSKPFHRIHK